MNHGRGGRKGFIRVGIQGETKFHGAKGERKKRNSDEERYLVHDGARGKGRGNRAREEEEELARV